MVFATASVPISDWWGGSHAIKRKKIEYQKAIDERQDKAELLKIRMQHAYNNVIEACQQLDIAQRSIEQSKENLRLNRDYYLTYTLRRFCDTFHPHLVCLSQMGTFVATTTAKIQRKNCRAAKTVVPLHRQKEQTTFQ